MNLFIFHIHSITPRQSIRYPDIMTKDKHYQLGITVMTLISHNLHTQVIMAWLRKILFFKKRRRSSDKKTQKCWVILYQHLCVFQDVCQIHCGILNTVSPHIPLYKHTIPKSICHVELHSNVLLSRRVILRSDVRRDIR